MTIDVFFEWIPAHAGIRGNDIVDNLAKKGSRKEYIDVRVPNTNLELTNQMISIYKELWQTEWEISERGRELFKIQTNTDGGLKVKIKTGRKEEVLLHQIRLGKCRLNYYLYILKCHVDGLCETCQKAETIEHYLSSCKRFKNERNIMKTKLKIIDLNILNIFNASITDNYCALLSFIRNTKRFE